jgi:hypothetical protein
MEMEDKLKKSFQEAQYRPERRLSDDILISINIRQARNTNIRFWAYSTTGVVSFVGFFLTLRLLIIDFTQSGFYEYLSLVFSDSRALSYWKEITLSITESLPMINLIISLSLFFIFVLSLRFMARNIRIRPKLLVI